MNPSTPPTSTRVVITPLRPALVEEQTNVLDVLVRVQAPDAPPASLLPSDTKRALALVIDSSGSMKGRPLDEAKRCAQAVVRGLRPLDLVAVVQFDQSVRLVWPATEVGDGLAVSDAIQRIEDGGATALHEGWFLGAQAMGACPLTASLRRVW